MSTLIAICDASFCPNQKFAYLGYRIFPFKKPLISSNLWFTPVKNSGIAEEQALRKLISHLRETELLQVTTIYSDHLHLVENIKKFGYDKFGIDIRHIQGHKSAIKRDWVDWQFFHLDKDLRNLLRQTKVQTVLDFSAGADAVGKVVGATSDTGMIFDTITTATG
jgi:hypothetical protein